MHWYDKAIEEIAMLAPGLVRNRGSNVAVVLETSDYPDVIALSKRSIKTLFGVYLPPGHWCSPHTHKEDVLIVMLHDHPTRLFIEDDPVETRRGYMELVPGDVRHHVEQNETDTPRFTLAVMYR